MGVIVYWRERLRDRNPLGSETLRIEKYNLRKREGVEDSWPRAVAKQALLSDYKEWFDRVYLPPFLDTGYYQDCPDQLPKPASDLDFFVTMSPFIHVVGRAQQTRAYMVEQQEQYEGRWITIKVHRNFVRLCEWEEHVATFELLTGMKVHAEPLGVLRDRGNMFTVSQGVKVHIKKIAGNREAMAVGKNRRVDEA